MKTYFGKRFEDTYSQGVFIEEDGKTRNLELDDSLKVKNHSPTGFNWGYGGSGPHQLALGILLDITGNDYCAETFYNQFVCEFVVGWGDDWSITEDEINEWLDKKRAELN